MHVSRIFHHNAPCFIVSRFGISVGMILILLISAYVDVRIVYACRQLVVETCCQVQVPSGLFQGVILGIQRAHHAVDATVVLHHNVQDSVNPFCIIFRTRLGDYLNLFHHVGRYRLQHLRRIARQRIVGTTVFVNFEITVSVHLNVVLSVNCHHRHFLQHFEYRAGLCILVAGHIIAQAVDFGSHKRLLCHHFHLRKNIFGLS